jgi:hypothetical protein
MNEQWKLDRIKAIKKRDQEELHTYVKCEKCKESVRSSLHTPEQCYGYLHFGKGDQ